MLEADVKRNRFKPQSTLADGEAPAGPYPRETVRNRIFKTCSKWFRVNRVHSIHKVHPRLTISPVCAPDELQPPRGLYGE